MIKLQLRALDHCDWEIGRVVLKPEIEEWLLERNMPYDFFFTHSDEGLGDIENLKASPRYFVIKFDNDEDAVAFKLVWL
jgi:hypothetical protein